LNRHTPAGALKIVPRLFLFLPLLKFAVLLHVINTIDTMVLIYNSLYVVQLAHTNAPSEQMEVLNVQEK